MNNRDIVVRIVQPADKPAPEIKPSRPAFPGKKERKPLQKFLNGLGLAAILACGGFFALGFFNFGFSLNDVIVIIGIPLAVGLITSYATA